MVGEAHLTRLKESAMPVEVRIWKLGKEIEKVEFSVMESEKKLEDLLVQDISILSPQLLLIGRQIPTGYGTFIDMLAMDEEGGLSVIELKKGRTPREVIAQLLDYASWVKSLTYEKIAEIYQTNNSGNALEEGFDNTFDSTMPEKINQTHQLILVAAKLDNNSERIINYLSEEYGVPINAVFFRYFNNNGAEYLVRSWLIDPHEADIKSCKTSSRGGREPWNGNDYYVSFGDGDRRVWDDAVKYGFVSAGGGSWYSRTLSQLSPGARIFVYIPQTGYVGVGKVLESVVPVKDFLVEIDGKLTPILQAQINAQNMGNGVDDPELSEYLVRVEWIETLPKEKAFKEAGLFANQNTVTKLRNSFTIEKLVKKFNLDD